MYYKLPNAHQPVQNSFPVGGGKSHIQTGWGAWPDCPLNPLVSTCFVFPSSARRPSNGALRCTEPAMPRLGAGWLQRRRRESMTPARRRRISCAAIGWVTMATDRPPKPLSAGCRLLRPRWWRSMRTDGQCQINAPWRTQTDREEEVERKKPAITKRWNEQGRQHAKAQYTSRVGTSAAAGGV